MAEKKIDWLSVVGEGLGAIGEALLGAAYQLALIKSVVLTAATCLVFGLGLLFFDLLGLPLGWIVALALIAFAVWVLFADQLWRQWLFGGAKDAELAREWRGTFRFYATSIYVLDALRALLALTAAFTVLAAALQAQELVSAEPADDNGFVWTALAYYAWQLLDAIPALEIPQTLNWDPPTKITDHLGGALLLAFKVLVVFPIVRLALALIRVWRGPPEPAGAQ